MFPQMGEIRGIPSGMGGRLGERKEREALTHF